MALVLIALAVIGWVRRRAPRAVAGCPRRRARPGTRADRRHRARPGPFDAPSSVSGVARQPPGADLTLEQLDADPYHAAGGLREREPVSWVPVLDGWLVTRRDLCIEVMRDAGRFTVDDPRFSTAQVVGPSMLSLDGEEHRPPPRPVRPGLPRPRVRERFTRAGRGRGPPAGQRPCPRPARAEIRGTSPVRSP